MALCRYLDRGQPTFALFREGQICPLSELTEDPVTDADVFARSADYFAALPAPRPDQWRPAPATLLMPVPPPQKSLCIGLNYRDHARETGAEIPTEPVVFNKLTSALIGHGDPIELPRLSQAVDFEAELVVVIGRAGRHIPAAAALEYVFGYTCGHDVSARDWQKGRPGGQWLLGKTFDTFGPVGPCVALRDEIPDAGQLRIEMIINGETMQDSSTDQLIFDIPTLISHLSQFVSLVPGDLIFTGTPPGVGAARQPPVFLQPGDECTVRIEQIGSLTNRCQAAST